MKNKLLLTTTLSAVVLSGVASAETKITGQLDINYSTRSSNVSTTSNQGFGKEAQINFANSGDLDNGMSYKAGFSYEADGNTPSNDENLHIDFISGNTTFSVGQDHGLNTDSSAVPRVSINAGSLATMTKAYAQGSGLGSDGQQHVKEGMGVFVAQKFDGGTAQIRFTPEAVQDAGSNDAITEGDEGSAMDINFQGNLGVDGLKVNAQYAKIEKAANSTHSGTRDSKGKALGVGYNFGQFAVGVQTNSRELGNSATEEYNTDEIGVTFAASDNISLGLAYAETEVKSAGRDEEVIQASVGYNLGAVAIHLNYAEYDNTLGSATASDEVGSIRFTTKF